MNQLLPAPQPDGDVADPGARLRPSAGPPADAIAHREPAQGSALPDRITVWETLVQLGYLLVAAVLTWWRLRA